MGGVHNLIQLQHSFIPPEKKGGGVEDFGSRDIGGGLALISGFWGDLRKRGSKIIQGGGVESLGSLSSLSWIY